MKLVINSESSANPLMFLICLKPGLSGQQQKPYIGQIHQEQKILKVNFDKKQGNSNL